MDTSVDYYSHKKQDRDSVLSQLGGGGEEEGDDEMQIYIVETWEKEFCPVATQLLRCMDAHASQLEPLEAPG
ncbi:hypothetical protein ACOMHN_014529 [Nucella lapillus]